MKRELKQMLSCLRTRRTLTHKSHLWMKALYFYFCSLMLLFMLACSSLSCFYIKFLTSREKCGLNKFCNFLDP